MKSPIIKMYTYTIQHTVTVTLENQYSSTSSNYKNCAIKIFQHTTQPAYEYLTVEYDSHWNYLAKYNYKPAKVKL